MLIMKDVQIFGLSSSGHYSSVLGFTAPYENGGIVDSWGVEIGANYHKNC